MSPHIESSDRAMIIDKKLLWTIIITLTTGIGGGGIWVGSTVTQLVTATQNLSESIAAESLLRERLERRTAALERGEARTDERLINLVQGVERIERSQAQGNIMLQNLMNVLGTQYIEDRPQNRE